MNIVLIILGALLILFLIVSARWGNGEKNYRLSPEVLRIFDVIIVLLILGIVVISFSVRQKHIEAEKDLAEQQEEVSVSDNESVSGSEIDDFTIYYPFEDDDVSGQTSDVSEDD